MQWINFGRIEWLTVRAGEPVLGPAARILREVKFGARNGPRPEIESTDFPLKGPVRELFAQLDAIGDGSISCLEIKHGLPFRMAVEGVCA